MYQQQGVISQNKKTSLSQNFPNRSFRVIHQHDRIFIFHIAVLSVFISQILFRSSVHKNNTFVSEGNFLVSIKLTNQTNVNATGNKL